MSTHQNVVKSCLLHQIFLNSVCVWGRTWSTFERILFWSLKSRLEGKSTIKSFHLFGLRVIVARTQILESNRFYVKRIENVSSFSDVVVRLSKSTFICQLLFVERREGFEVVMNVWARFIGLLRSIKHFSLRETEAPSLLELGIFLLEYIFQCVVWCRWSFRLAGLLESVTLGEANRNKRVPHCVCRLFLTYKTEKLRSELYVI